MANPLVPADQADMQKPQSPMDKHGPGYDNDVAPDWRRGMGADQAEGKPGYVRTGHNPPNRG